MQYPRNVFSEVQILQAIIRIIFKTCLYKKEEQDTNADTGNGK
jgi:hypothetical protein